MFRLRFITITLGLLVCGFIVKAQTIQCDLSLKGRVHTSDGSAIPSSVVLVYLSKIKQGIYADSNGHFIFKNLCPGKYELIIRYLGYQTIDTTLQINHSVHADFLLTKETKQLKSITIKKNIIHKSQITTAIKDVLGGQALEQTRGLSLGESLKEVAGINSIQSGPSVSKPVIHGVYGNRILILNNGVRQAGQKWGNDHAPEIDPFIANKFTVIKGAASIRYGSDALGGVVLAQPKKMRSKPGIDGEATLVGMSNGYTGVASAMMEGALNRHLKGLSWRLQGTTKKAGNSRAAHYYEKNTGFYENDYSASLQYKHANWGLTGYYSRFHTKIGIATASATETVSDLKQAIAAPVPIEKAGFTYAIERPYQKVNHQLLKADGYINLPKMGKIEMSYAWQKDIREEYDRDISYSDSLAALNLPDLYFQLITNTSNLVWDMPVIGKKIFGSIGINYITQGNVLKHTAFQELIPNFRNYGGGAFIIEKLPLNKLMLEAGYRYDYRWLRAYKLEPNTLVKTTPTYSWQNSTFTLGATYQFNEKLSARYNFGSAWRPPQVIELFANGIHQAAASYQIGDSSLTLEKSYDNSFSLDYSSRKLQAEIDLYYNYYHHYIYAKPSLHFKQTLRGAFPVYKYKQGNALFRGIDFSFTYHFLPHFSFISKSSLVRVRNLSIHDWLINIPADRFDNTLKYTLPSLGKLQDCFISLGNLVVSRQSRTPPHSDFAPAPPGYMLWNADIGCSIPLKSHKVDISLSVTNLANTSYRDYLNRFRYYLDDLGRNITLRVHIPFGSDGKNKNTKN